MPPLQRQARGMTCGINRRLRRSTRYRICIERVRTIVAQRAAIGGEHRSTTDSRRACESSTDDRAVAFTAGQREIAAAARRGRLESCACAGCVPFASTDEAALRTTTSDDVQEARTSKGRTG